MILSGVENFQRVTKITEIKNELKEYDFEMKLLRDAESYIAIAGDGEAVYIFLLLLPYNDRFKIKKRHIWKFKTLAYKFKAKPYLLTYQVMTTVYPLHALEDAGEYFVLDTEKVKVVNVFV
jgi:Archaeal holliday junction resolvase (hjc).